MFLLQELGRRVAAVAVRMLNGEKGGDIKTPVMRLSAPIYDWRELQRWGISESRLPAGSEIRFRQPSLWEQYRWQISLVASVILLQTALIAGLLYEHRRRRGAEASARNSLSELAHVNRLATAGELSASIAHEIKPAADRHRGERQRGPALAFGRQAQSRRSARPRSRTSSRPAIMRPTWSRTSGASSRRSLPQNTLLDLNDLVRRVLSLAATRPPKARHYGHDRAEASRCRRLSAIACN